MILPLVYVKALLLLFISDAKSNLGSKHHLSALHKVVDWVFQDWFEGVGIKQIEIYFLVGNDLESFVAFDVVQLSFETERVILFPVHVAVVFIFFQFQQKHMSRAPHYHDFVFVDVHMA